jgi:hypothetical protein
MRIGADRLVVLACASRDGARWHGIDGLVGIPDYAYVYSSADAKSLTERLALRQRGRYPASTAVADY